LVFFWTFPSSGIQETRKHDVSETGSVSVLQWLRLALSKGPNWVGVFSPLSPKDGNRSSFRNVVFSSLLNTRRWKSPKSSVILCVIHHRQNPTESNSISVYNLLLVLKFNLRIDIMGWPLMFFVIIERFSIKKLNNVEGEEQYSVCSLEMLKSLILFWMSLTLKHDIRQPRKLKSFTCQNILYSIMILLLVKHFPSKVKYFLFGEGG
jgi:hypothetical protein